MCIYIYIYIFRPRFGGLRGGTVGSQQKARTLLDALNLSGLLGILTIQDRAVITLQQGQPLGRRIQFSMFFMFAFWVRQSTVKLNLNFFWQGS